jgi:endonuclease G
VTFNKAVLTRWISIGGLCIAATVGHAEPIFIEKEYDGFTIYLDCRNNGPIAYQMSLGPDQDDFQRLSGFFIDESLPTECQMTSVGSFNDNQPVGDLGIYHRGHLADANSLDSRQQSIEDSNFVTNMLPQALSFNGGGGAWRHTEEIAERYREKTLLRIWGGVIWGDNEEDDAFVESHNVITPDRWWKVIYRFDTDTYIAWIFDNNQDEKRAVMNDRIKTLDEVKAELEFVPDFGPAENATASATTWEVVTANPMRCEGTEAHPS